MVRFSILDVIIFSATLNLKSNSVSLILIRCHFSIACITEELLHSTPSPLFTFDMQWKSITNAQLLFFNFATPFFNEIIFAASFLSSPIHMTGLTLLIIFSGSWSPIFV